MYIEQFTPEQISGLMKMIFKCQFIPYNMAWKEGVIEVSGYDRCDFKVHVIISDFELKSSYGKNVFGKMNYPDENKDYIKQMYNIFEEEYRNEYNKNAKKNFNKNLKNIFEI